MSSLPRQVGPYRIIDIIGRGGMGVVYRGEHLETGQTAAVKTVTALGKGLLQNIRREIHALARIRHPGIVRILDEGVVDGVPWYAMELLAGKTLRHHVVDTIDGSARTIPAGQPLAHSAVTPDAGVPPVAATVFNAVTGVSGDATDSGTLRPIPRSFETVPKVSLERTLTLVRRLCSPLAFLHGEGLVHRDLKPDNVLVRPNGSPVLVDFGVTTQFTGEQSREALEVGGEMVGTVSYMAPEQILGDFVDARADLYALGCILYELLTGRPPFVGADRIEVGRAHLHSEPLPPSELMGGLPFPVDDLVLRLLAKRPRDRLGHAKDVAAILAELGATVETTDETGGVSIGRRTSDAPPAPRDYLYRPGLSGRAATLERLEIRITELEAGRGGIILIGGESGVGKTRLAMELARKARLRRMRVLTGQAMPVQCPETLGALRGPLQHLADTCREGGRAITERLIGRHGDILSAYVPAFVELLGASSVGEAERMPMRDARPQLFAAITQTFEALAGSEALPSASVSAPRGSDPLAGRPVVLVLDDLQWADELTLGWLDALSSAGGAGSEPRSSLLVVGTYRSDEVAAHQDSPLQALVRRPQVTQVELERLEEGDVGAMVRDMLAMDPAPPSFVRYLTQHSEGNPFYVAEFLRTAVAEGLLYRNERGIWDIAASETGADAEPRYESLPLPGSIRDLVGRRLQGLPDTSRRLVEAAAVAGREADVLLVWAMSRLEDGELLDALNELLRRQVLDMPLPGRMQFLHDKIREVAYEQTAGDRLAQLHRAAAQTLDNTPDAEKAELLAALGGHWERAGVPDQALHCYLTSARRAASRYAHEEAQRLYRAALRVTDDRSAEAVEARVELASKVHRIQGKHADALEMLHDALAIARRRGDLAAAGDCLLRLSFVYKDSGQLGDAQELADEALVLHRAVGDRRLEGKALGHLATIFHELNRLEQARALTEQALGIARETGDQKAENLLLGNLAVYHRRAGLHEQARELYGQGLALARATADPRSESIHLANLAALSHEQGQLETALELQRQVLELVRKVGDRRLEATVLDNFALFHNDAGQYQQARELYEQALRGYRESGARRSEGLCLSDLGQFHAERGNSQAALESWEQALQVQRELGDHIGEGIVLRRKADLLRRGGSLSEADETYREAKWLLRETGSAQELGLSLCGRGHLALARQEDAVTFLTRAEGIAASLRSTPRSDLRHAIDRLRRAIDASVSGRSLVFGECPEDLPTPTMS